MSNVLVNQKATIVKLLAEKSVVKQNVFNNTLKSFEILKESIDEISQDLLVEANKIDTRIGVEVTQIEKYSVRLKVAGDVLECFMHTNVFEFDKSHPLFKSSYIKQNEYNSYCGIINVYNFLADSFKYNRFTDVGYLMCRIFVNREMRFFVECKGPIGSKYASFSNEELTKETLTEIINELIIYAISFDLFIPPFDSVREVSVAEMQEKVNSQNLRTGKRLGYGTAPEADEDPKMYI